jgi:EAL domain-containing protein (putative c-di-GMP-specific phosphodiesterase class I)
MKQLGRDQGEPVPYLEHFPEPGALSQRMRLEPLPFRIGRSASANYTLFSRHVSKEHSEIYLENKEYRIRDLGSTNGTFVNGQRVQEAGLTHGDIIHIAHKELKFGCETNEAEKEAGPIYTEPAWGKPPASLIRGRLHLQEMLDGHSARIVFQPIVHLDDAAVIGYEALGRGTHSGLSTSPGELFGLANQCRLAAELSRMFRQVAVEEAEGLPANARVFFNLHPSEMDREVLIESLRELRTAFQGGRHVVLEVNEQIVADIGTMRWLRDQVNQLGMSLAYDDFGAGQSRLSELAEVPPEYIKLDRSLIHQIDESTARQELVQALTRVITDLGAQVIAEGIETAEEARVCRNLGCRLGQGFLFGRPQPLPLLHLDREDLGALRR